MNYLLSFIMLFGATMTQPSINNSCVDGFELSKYMGEWYEIARFENRFERGLESVSAHYTLLPDGSIEVINRGFDTTKNEWSEAKGRAKRTSTTALLKVSFFLFFYSEYRIISLGDINPITDQYEWSLVGSKSDKYLWILSRTPTLPQQTIYQIVEAAKERGYDTAKLKFVNQVH